MRLAPLLLLAALSAQAAGVTVTDGVGTYACTSVRAGMALEFLPPGCVPNSQIKPGATLDFNGDGKSDILYRNEATGEVYIMLMDGPKIIGQALVHTEPNLAWKIAATGDYNGDGKTDLLWRNATTGQLHMMLMNGLVIGPQATFYTEPNPAWKVLGGGQ